LIRILVVEDDYLLATELKHDIEKLNGEVVGPVGRRAQALALARTEPLDGALLDINLNNGDTLEVAEALRERGVPFAFVTGYRDRELPAALAGAPRLVKPVQQHLLKETLDGFAARLR
jgi:CheY-like chemotaxis protein